MTGYFVFFFSSRRRHTRFDCDWSSDVCSSDLGGDDRLIVRGTGGSGPLLRVIGGGGDDELTDSSRVGGTQFYDDRGNDRFVTRPGTSVDRRHYDEPPRDTSTVRLPRAWGGRQSTRLDSSH